jgi:hypothetical protein
MPGFDAVSKYQIDVRRVIWHVYYPYFGEALRFYHNAANKEDYPKPPGRFYVTIFTSDDHITAEDSGSVREEAAMILLVLAIVLAVLHWVAVLIKSRWLVGATKPTMMLALIAWVWIYSDLPALLAQPETFRLLWFVLGLSFSLAGDVFLLWPKHLFTPGLVAFLIGHVFYILGFNRLLLPGGAIVVCLVVAIVQAGCGVWMYRQLARGLEASGAARMKIPVGV